MNNIINNKTKLYFPIFDNRYGIELVTEDYNKVNNYHISMPINNEYKLFVINNTNDIVICKIYIDTILLGEYNVNPQTNTYIINYYGLNQKFHFNPTFKKVISCSMAELFSIIKCEFYPVKTKYITQKSKTKKVKNNKWLEKQINLLGSTQVNYKNCNNCNNSNKCSICNQNNEKLNEELKFLNKYDTQNYLKQNFTDELIRLSIKISVFQEQSIENNPDPKKFFSRYLSDPHFGLY